MGYNGSTGVRAGRTSFTVIILNELISKWVFVTKHVSNHYVGQCFPPRWDHAAAAAACTAQACETREDDRRESDRRESDRRERATGERERPPARSRTATGNGLPGEAPADWEDW